MRGLDVVALAAATLGTGCIYVTINFPEAQIREAAAQIVDEVHSDAASTEPQADPKAEPESRGSAAPEAKSTTGGLFDFFRPRTAFAEPQEQKIQIEVSTPVIKAIKETLKKRYAK